MLWFIFLKGDNVWRFASYTKNFLYFDLALVPRNLQINTVRQIHMKPGELCIPTFSLNPTYRTRSLVQWVRPTQSIVKGIIVQIKYKSLVRCWLFTLPQPSYYWVRGEVGISLTPHYSFQIIFILSNKYSAANPLLPKIYYLQHNSVISCHSFQNLLMASHFLLSNSKILHVMVPCHHFHLISYHWFSLSLCSSHTAFLDILWGKQSSFLRTFVVLFPVCGGLFP